MRAIVRRFKDWRYQVFYWFLLKKGYELRTLGDPQGICQWTICPKGLGPKSVVYSGGLGSEITFEHDLVKHFGCNLVLYDPSPTGVKTMSLPENKIPQFHYFEVALTNYRGKLNLGAPKPGEDSWFARKDGTGAMEVPCTDLRSLMDQNGHNHIDLLKLDIEGAEYAVIGDLLKRRLSVRQICVEYHHGILPDFRRSDTVRSMLKLVAHGYKLVDQTGNNHTFIKAGPNPSISTPPVVQRS